jgi:hypothetical protein
MDRSVNITATISDKDVVSNFVGSLPLQQKCSFENILYSQTFGTTNPNNLNNCVSFSMFAEILRGFADEKTVDFLESYKIFIPNAENVYIALSLIIKNSPSIQAIVFSIGEDSIFGFDGASGNLKFSLIPKEKNEDLYYSSLINHEHYHEVFEKFKDPIGLLFLKYEKNSLTRKQDRREFYKRPDFSIADVAQVIFNTLEKINPVFNVSGDFLSEDFEFENVTHYLIKEAMTLNVDILDFLISR